MLIRVYPCLSVANIRIALFFIYSLINMCIFDRILKILIYKGGKMKKFNVALFMKLPGKIQVFFIFRSQNLLRVRYLEGRLKKPGIMGIKGNMKSK